MNSPSQPSPHWRINRLIFLMLIASGAIVTYLLPIPPFRLPLCLFKLITGYPCAGCGMTRSVLACVHGRLREAFQWHPLGLVFSIGVVCISVAIIYELITGKQLLWDLWMKRWGIVIAWVIFLSLILIWSLRLSYIHWGQWLPIPLKTKL